MAETAEIRQEFDREIVDYQQLTTCLSHLSKSRDKINKLLRKGDIVRIRKGLYTFGRSYRRGPVSRELLANLIYGPSYVSLEYALSYHGLIPERVSTVFDNRSCSTSAWVRRPIKARGSRAWSSI